MTNQEFEKIMDERMAAERKLVCDILRPFYGLRDLLRGEPRNISTDAIEPLLSNALEQAESLTNGEEFAETAAG
ncbi:MAG: hypothetical protein GX433_08505 [Deltaproteobacteria bacterium]|nr:hypothetical protein [Deltaproteobacteria bacterium]